MCSFEAQSLYYLTLHHVFDASQTTGYSSCSYRDELVVTLGGRDRGDEAVYRVYTL